MNIRYNFLKQSRRALSIAIASLFMVLPVFGQQGLFISNSADFSSDDRVFTDGETIYIKAVPTTDLDLMAVTDSDFELEPAGDGEEHEGTLDFHEDGSFTASVEVSALVGSSTAWLLKISIEDEFDNAYEARTAVVVRGRTPEREIFTVRGTVDSATETEIVIGDQSLAVTEDTKIRAGGDADLTPADLEGRHVVVLANRNEDGTATALQIFVPGRDEVVFAGRITAVGASSITIRGTTFEITETTVIEGADGELPLSELTVGAFARVEARRSGETWIATEIDVRTLADRGGDDRGGDRGDNGDQEISGTVEAVGDGTITVGGITFEVNEDTEIDGADALTDIPEGATVEIEFFVDENGTHVAAEIEVEDAEDDDADEIEVQGLITAVSDNSITVEGVEFVVDDDTEIEGDGGVELTFGDLHTGLRVEAEGTTQSDGSVLATKIKVEEDEESERLTIRGEIAEVDADGNVTIDETTFLVTEDTEIRGERGAELTLDDLEAGLFARAHLTQHTDGSLTAERMKVERPFEEDDVKVTGRIEAVSATEITVQGMTFVVDESTEVEGHGDTEIAVTDLQIGQVVKVEGERDDAGVLVADEIKVRGRLHNEGRFAGIVTANAEGSLEVNGIAFTVTEETIIEGAASVDAIVEGDHVKLRYRLLGDGSRLALRVEVKTDSENEAEISGAIDSIDGDVIVISEVNVLITAATEIEDADGNAIASSDLEVGQTVEVEGIASAEGIVADKIKVEDSVVISGSVRSQTSGAIQVAGNEFQIDVETLIVGRNNSQVSLDDLKAGTFVEVIAVNRTETTGKNGGDVMHAERILVMGSSSPTAIEDRDLTVPDVFTLTQNYPNPFNPSTTITFEIAKNSADNVSLVIFDVLGRQVRTLVEGTLSPGQYSYVWNGRDDGGSPVASGLYLYRLQVDEHTATRSMTLIK